MVESVTAVERNPTAVAPPLPAADEGVTISFVEVAGQYLIDQITPK